MADMNSKTLGTDSVHGLRTVRHDAYDAVTPTVLSFTYTATSGESRSERKVMVDGTRKLDMFPNRVDGLWTRHEDDCLWASATAP